MLLAKQMHDQGMSLRKISAELAARGSPPSPGAEKYGARIAEPMSVAARRDAKGRPEGEMVHTQPKRTRRILSNEAL